MRFHISGDAFFGMNGIWISDKSCFKINSEYEGHIKGKVIS